VDTTIDNDAPVAFDRSQLWPKSGIGARGTYLIIAPKNNPVIKLDARLLDRIELIGRSPKGALVMAGAATAGIVAAALTVIPGGIFTVAGCAYLAHERVSEARRRLRSRDLLLALGDLEVALHVADGAEAAKRIADQLSPYTRTAPITRPEVYEDAKRRLYTQSQGLPDGSSARELEGGLVVGTDVVHVTQDFLHVGERMFHIDDVREYALRGANLPLPNGRLLQAAMGLLVVAAEKRARKGEDLDELSRRVSEYESWTGRSAGR
jgi:hypothetical protein